MKNISIKMTQSEAYSLIDLLTAVSDCDIPRWYTEDLNHDDLDTIEGYLQAACDKRMKEESR